MKKAVGGFFIWLIIKLFNHLGGHYPPPRGFRKKGGVLWHAW